DRLEREAVPEEAARLPRRHGLELIGERVRIAGELERLDREHRRGRVVAVAALAGRREAGDEHVGLEDANVPDDVGEHRVVAPDGQRLLRVLRIAEVDGAREGLLASVDAPRRQELLREDDAEELAL